MITNQYWGMRPFPWIAAVVGMTLTPLAGLILLALGYGGAINTAVGAVIGGLVTTAVHLVSVLRDRRAKMDG